MNIKKELTCKHCNEIYINPITLNCCGENICKQHIENLPACFTCPLCNQENQYQNFKVNKLIQMLIENELHKLEIDPKCEMILINFKSEIEKLEAILKDPEHFVYEEINELKRLIDLDREKLKGQIDELANNLIQQLETHEVAFKAEYMNNINFVKYKRLLESSRKQLNEYEKCLSMFSSKNEEREEKCVQGNKTINNSKSKIKQVKDDLFSGLSLIYKPMVNKVDDIFGILVIKKKKDFSGTVKKVLREKTAALQVLPNGYLITGSNENSIKIWDVYNGIVKHIIYGHSDWIRNFLIIDDKCFASASDDKTIKLWNSDDFTLIKTLRGHTGIVLTLAFLKNGDLASGSYDCTIKIWNIKSDKIRTLTEHVGCVWSLLVLENGDLVSGSDDHTIKIWDVNSGAVKNTLIGHTGGVYDLVLLENDDLISGSNDNTIRIWDLNTGMSKRTLIGHTKYVFALKLLENGDLASGSEDGSIKIWNLEEGSVKKTLQLGDSIYSLAVLDNGDLVSACMNGNILIWN